MNGDDRLRPLVDELGDARGIDVEIVVAHVREHRRRARVHDDVRRRRPRDRRDDHLVALADAERDERKVECRRAGRDREHVLRVEQRRRALLELRRLRPRRQPARTQRF